jgi:hypothetical protein
MKAHQSQLVTPDAETKYRYALDYYDEITAATLHRAG